MVRNGGAAAVALLAGGEQQAIHLSAPGSSDGTSALILGRGTSSSAYLRDRLNDPSVSREHIRVEALPASSVNTTSPSVRVTVIGVNPIAISRREQPAGEKTLLSHGQSAVLETGDGFSFCKGFDGVIHVVAAASTADAFKVQEGQGQGNEEATNEHGNESTPDDAMTDSSGRKSSGYDDDETRRGRAALGERGRMDSRSETQGDLFTVSEIDSHLHAPGASFVGDSDRRDKKPRAHVLPRCDGGDRRPAPKAEADTTLRGLRMALITHGFSKQRRKVFRDRAAQFGAEAHDWPPTASAGSLSSPFKSSSVGRAPGALELLSPGSGVSAAALLGSLTHHRQMKGRSKGKKRPREPPSPQPYRPIPPCPSPRRTLPTFRSELSEDRSEGHSEEESAGNNSAERIAESAADSTSAAVEKDSENDGDGHLRPDCDKGTSSRSSTTSVLDDLSRLGFTHAVCASAASRRTLRAALGLSTQSSASPSSRLRENVSGSEGMGMEAEGGIPRWGGGGGGCGLSVELVSEEWLVKCFQEERRLAAAPYRLSLSTEGSDSEQHTEELQEMEMRNNRPFEVKRYACQRPTPRQHHNHEVVDVLDALSELYDVVGESERALSYQRAASILRSLPRKLQASKEIRHVPGIGKRIAENIDEILATGRLQRLDRLRQPRAVLNLLDPCAKRMSWAFFPGRRKNDVSDTFVHVAVRVVLQAGLEMDVVLDNDDTEMHVVCQALSKVHGVGPKTAVTWYNNGVRSVKDAQQLVKDGDATLKPISGEIMLGLEHFEDLQVPMTRQEMVEIAEYIRKQADELGRERDPDGTVFFEVCGGFRRGKEASHDVDCLVSFQRGDGNSGHEGFAEDLKERLVSQGKLRATLFQGKMGGFGRGDTHTPSLSREEVLMGIWQLPDRTCRVDIVQVACSQWPFSVLGWSGNRFFEREIRQYAKDELGLRLSQKGLSPVDSNTPLPDVFKTEEDIFRRLKLSYIPPHLRWS